MQSPRIRAWDTQRWITLLQIFQTGLERKKRLYCLFFSDAESNIFKMYLVTQQCHSHGFWMENS